MVAAFHWRGSKATDKSPLLSLCGKGVCFDTGGYDLKPAAGMLRMKKDMGGAANVLGMARIVMEADLPMRLAVRIGCVENSVSGTAMRPLDVIRTRRGLTVEVGNTDAEGRLVLCDLLAEASDEQPALLVDCATLTGAARVGAGARPAGAVLQRRRMGDSPVAGRQRGRRPDVAAAAVGWLRFVAGQPGRGPQQRLQQSRYAGAIVAALFLRRFVAPGPAWAHIDMYRVERLEPPGPARGRRGADRSRGRVGRRGNVDRNVMRPKPPVT